MTKCTHTIPVGSIVEVISRDLGTFGLRLFVVLHTYKWDGAPTYELSFDAKSVESTKMHAKSNGRQRKMVITSPPKL